MAEHKSNNDERGAGPSRKGSFAGDRQHVAPSKDVADPHPRDDAGKLGRSHCSQAFDQRGIRSGDVFFGSHSHSPGD